MGPRSLTPITHENWMNEAKAARIPVSTIRPDEKPSEWARRLGLPGQEAADD